MALPIVCFDMDGTLVNEKGKIHPRDVEILTSNQQVRWIPCTGRMRDSIRDIFTAHGLFVDQPIPFPLVTQNGATTYLPDEKLLGSLTFAPDIRRQLVEIASQIPTVTSFISTDTEMLALYPNDFARKEAVRFNLTSRPYDDSAPDLPLAKIMCISDDPASLAQMAHATRDIPVEKAFSMPTIFEITPLGASKGQGLARLLRAMQVNGAPIYVAGDGGNDLSLFEIATASFAPVTCPPEIQAHADHVIDPRPAGLLTPIINFIAQQP